MRVAIVGAGIAGLSCAWLLSRHAAFAHQVTIYEQHDYLGGHTNTVDVTLDHTTFPVDTGFLVFNDWTYPNLIALFRHLGVDTAPSDMSFGIKLIDRAGRGRLEWCGSNDIRTVFAQPSNLWRPKFLGMLKDMLRFNRAATALADGAQGDPARLPGTLGQYLDLHRYGAAFRDWYLKPMAACIWSTPTQRIDDFPLATFLTFSRNHGLLSVSDRPQWRTVRGGARRYVQKLAADLPDIRLHAGIVRIDRAGDDVTIHAGGRADRYDQVVFACHTDQALALLQDRAQGDVDAAVSILSRIPYQTNTAILHTDTRVLPDRPRAWAAWNYMARHQEPADARHPSTAPSAEDARVSLTYLINRLQPLPVARPVLVTMNPLVALDPARVLKSIQYAHPVFLADSATARRELREVQGRRRTWYAGAWTRYGFHEDGLMSGIAVARALGAVVPWATNVPAADDLAAPYPGVDA